MVMDLRHARTFVAVAEFGTVSAAALRLRIAQPALSRQIAALEDEFGLKLFDRMRGRLLLTAAGEALLGDCQHLLKQASSLGERAQLLKHGETGTLRVAASPQFIEGVIAKFWQEYAERYPKVEVKLVEALGWANVRTLLERGEIHLGQTLLRAAPADDQQFGRQLLEPVYELAACHPALDLGKQGAVEVSQLAAWPLLLLDTEFVFRRTFDAACRLAGVAMNVRFESRTPHPLLAMAQEKHGVAIIPSVLPVDRSRLRVFNVSFRGKPLSQPLAIFWDKRRTLPRYAAGFCEMLAAHMRKTRPSEPKKISRRRGTASGR
ncbi:LysR family transcriptional regulator [Bradyrhizobium sp. 200]|uniref:LysR family transcriptional regulator n=1 Tax=Bradyrhizobium sp. 200 TaxID=2782665 RepID=UPI001FFF498B|nr:LysR family transcriptional regulator [Bradyrhizobium sp. 200]UPJ52309.1 LysR family transcriptional regulator [Bradyrhizobium sp. 200]